MEEAFSLSKLMEFLHGTLLVTEEVRSVLRSDCEEAAYCLKPWHAEINRQQEVRKDCTCPKSENEVEEIAAGISRALIQTQQLRENVSLDTREKYPKALSAYESSKETGSKKQRKIRELSASRKNVCSAKPSNRKTENIDRGSSSRKKNFLAINKRNVKTIGEVKQGKDERNVKPGSSKAEAKCIKFGERRSAASTSELKSLIEKVSSSSIINSATSTESSSSCPLHGDAIARSTQHNSIPITVVDSFNTVDIPAEIIQPLKIYHAYLNMQLSEDSLNEKRQKGVQKFLAEFNKMDNFGQEKLTRKDRAANSLLEFMPLFQALFSGNLQTCNLTDIKSKCRELNSEWNTHESEKFSGAKILESDAWECCPPAVSPITQAASNGIWNFRSSKSFEELSKALCIRYTSEAQLLEFFDAMQKLQHARYSRDLIGIIEKDILPNMKTFFQPTQVEYVKLYKMISILCQGLNPKIPVLVRTDKQCNFANYQKVEVDIKPHAGCASNYIRTDPATQGTQCSSVYSVHEVNTNTATFRDSGMYHSEGGWPKDLNAKDTEQAVRYKRKIEKDELYIHTMLQLLPPMEQCVLQNNACNIYEQYFSYMEPASLIQRVYSRTVNVYRDMLPTKRQVTHLSWSPDQGTRFAASYCNTDFKKPTNDNPQSYIWDVENPNTPCAILKPFSPILTLEYNPKDSNILMSGLLTGQVACWDIRKGSEPVDASLVELSHRDLCNEVLWINSKTGTEFFSASKDGQIMWWDMRKLQAPTETLVIDLCKADDQNVNKATGISALQFEPSMGTRFMCGLENGVVISGNRKGKTAGEKIATRFRAQYGPVISLERNPTFIKNFLTVGDWTTRIWSEDCKESCIAWTPGHRDFLMGGAWSLTRFSVFFLIKMDGTLDVWDLLVQQDSPVLSIKICDEALTCIKPHEQGHVAAVANKKGTTFLLEFSEALTANQKNDKLLFTALLDRETRREKVIEAKNREQRLKMKSLRNANNFEMDCPAGNAKADEKESKGVNWSGNDAVLAHCEEDYESLIKAELMKEEEATTNGAEATSLNDKSRET